MLITKIIFTRPYPWLAKARYFDTKLLRNWWSMHLWCVYPLLHSGSCPTKLSCSSQPFPRKRRRGERARSRIGALCYVAVALCLFNAPHILRGNEQTLNLLDALEKEIVD